MREVPLSHSCRQTGWCISGGRTPADHGKASGVRRDCPVAGAKPLHVVCSRTDCFCLGKFFCSHWRGQVRRELVSVLAGEGWTWAGPADRGGLSGSFFSYTERHAGSWRGMSARLRCSANFFRTACEKKPSRVDVKNIFYDTRLPGSGGQALLPPKAGKSAIARKKILPAVKKT